MAGVGCRILHTTRLRKASAWQARVPTQFLEDPRIRTSASHRRAHMLTKLFRQNKQNSSESHFVDSANSVLTICVLHLARNSLADGGRDDARHIELKVYIKLTNIY